MKNFHLLIELEEKVILHSCKIKVNGSDGCKDYFSNSLFLRQ